MNDLAYKNIDSIDDNTSDKIDYDIFCKFLETACGLQLGDSKNYLVNSRLRNIKEQYGFKNLNEIVNAIKSNRYNELKADVIDAMTTNETSWFRDSYPFEVLKSKIFPELKDSHHPVRIWSAACSYGHEAYSISMAFQEYIERHLGQHRQGLEIVGTDISRNVLNSARSAKFDDLGLARGLSEERKQKYFSHIQNGMQLKDKIRQRVHFREFNLLNNYSVLGQFDVVFCRNVLIYFSNANKSSILKKITQCLRPNGYLFLGASEPILNYCDDFEMVSTHNMVFYQKK